MEYEDGELISEVSDTDSGESFYVRYDREYAAALVAQTALFISRESFV